MSAVDQRVPRGLEQDPLRSVQATLHMLVERAASTIALGRLVERDRGTLRQQTHFDALIGLLAGGSAVEEAASIAASGGFPIGTSAMAAVAVMLAPIESPGTRRQQDRLHQVAGTTRSHCTFADIPYLAAQIEDDVILMLVAAENGPKAERRAQSLAQSLLAETQGIAGIASSEAVKGEKGAAGGLAEALETVKFARILDVPTKLIRRADLGLEGFLLSVIDDRRLHDFTRLTLDALRNYDDEHDADLANALRTFLFSGRNKTVAAKRAFVSRAWLYTQLERVEKILGVHLDDEEVCLSLQVAILAEDIRAKVESAQQRDLDARHN